MKNIVFNDMKFSLGPFLFHFLLYNKRLSSAQAQPLPPACEAHRVELGASYKSVYEIGVLANRGVETALEEYTSTAIYLTQEIGGLFDPPISFEVKPVTFGGGDSAVAQYESLAYDFVYANPSIVSCVDSSVGINPLSTVMSRRKVNDYTHELTQFGGVIFTLQENKEIFAIEDIRNKSVGCISVSGLGSGQMQFRELQKAGINQFQDVKQLLFMENQNAIVKAVVEGDIDVGFVRTDQLERNQVDFSTIRIINAQNIEYKGAPFPFQVSTPLYPEWSLASIKSVPEEIAQAVQASLLRMSEHAVVAGPLTDCLQENGCYLPEDQVDTACRDACFASLDASVFERCDTTAEISLLANDALSKSKKAGWRSALSLMELRNMQEEIQFIRYDSVTRRTECSRSTAIADAVICPEGHFKKPDFEIENGCADLGLDCMGFQCVCSPCVKAYDVAFEPMLNGKVNLRASGCGKFEVCGTVEQMDTISFQAIDNKKRANSVASARILIQDRELDYPMSLLSEGVTNELVVYEFDFDASNLKTGIIIVEVFLDNIAIPESPFRFEIVPRDCQAATGEALREPDQFGNCVCERSSIEIRGSCIELKKLLPSTLVPTMVLMMIAMIAYVEHKRKKSDSIWKVYVHELEFADPPLVLGQGSFGLVLLAEYRGTQVAVKRALPPKDKMARGGSSTGGGSDHKGSGSHKGVASLRQGTMRNIPEDLEMKEDQLELGLGSVPGDEEIEKVRTASRVRFTLDASSLNDMSKQFDLEEDIRTKSDFRAIKQGSLHIPKKSSGSSGGRSSNKRGWRFFSKSDYSRMQQDFISEMRHLSKLRHPCITTVMGAVVEGVKEPMLVMEHMEMGSFYDLLHNDSMMIESEIVVPILRNVAQGLRFLHSANPSVVHGDLKSKNVLVDSQFRAKVADFGMSPQSDKSHAATGTPLWMAPELLRRKASNSPQTDVYSFGILTYEAFSRKIPYDGIGFNEAIQQIVDPNICLRPPVPQSCPKVIGDLMRQCIKEEASDRPSASFIDITLKSVNAEETRADDLLSELFPQSVATALRDGQKVKPESHECVTVFFSDIVGYTQIASTLEPTKVSDLLDRLYTTFDRLCGLHNVFKVETVGDAYMTVTNLATKQEDHVSIMAHFAMDAINAAANTLIDTDDPARGNIQIRVGFHSGPVASHVVGSRNPRFSIIGDTVNIASRMESTSKPGRIHCSQQSATILSQQSSDFNLVSRGVLEIKGKGKMSTFWVKPGDTDTATESSTSRERDDAKVIEEIKPSSSAVPSETADSKEKSRLIAWNVAIFRKYLKRLVAYRQARVDRTSSSEPEVQQVRQTTAVKRDPLDEVAEIIDLPEYDPRAARALKDSDSVVLPEDVLAQLLGFVTTIAHMYQDNPFHSFQHASHVTQSIDKLLTSVIEPRELQGVDDRRKEFTVHEYTYGISSDPMTHLAVVFSALIHDVDHPGVPNAQLVREKSDLAAFYKNKSIAEQNSVDLSWNLLMDSSFKALRTAVCETREEMERFRKLVVNTVLATDIVDKQLKELRNQRWDLAFSEKAMEGSPLDNFNRKATVVIEHLIQASDVAHTMQHWHIYRKWNERFFVECYEAFLAGRAATDPSINWYKGELGFFDFYIIPLTRKLKDCGVFGASSSEYLNCAMRNRAEWEIRGKEVVMGMIEKVRAQQAKRGR